MNRRWRTRLGPALVAVLCALHAWLAAGGSRQLSTTVDELAHLTAGYAYWTTDDFRLQPENGNFPQRWAALPLVLHGVSSPAPTDPAWATADVWGLGRSFFYHQGNDLPGMLAAARTMIALWSGLLCALVFIWARPLIGRRGAWLALTLAVFSPTLLAHGGLATSDTAAALGFVAATLAWARVLHIVTPGRVLVAGLAAGFLALAKFSAALFLPIAVIATALRFLRRKPVQARIGPWRPSWRGSDRVLPLAGAAVSAAAVALTLIWAAYGFRYAASDESGVSFIQSWDEVLLVTPPVPGLDSADGRAGAVRAAAPGAVQATVRWLRDRQLLPEAYLYGLAFVDKHARGRLAYFAGEYRTEGWAAFFPTAFLLKSTLPELILLALGIAALATRGGPRRAVRLYRLGPLLALVAVYAAFSLQSRLNIGHRHLLPLYPALCIIAGGAALTLNRRGAWVVVLVLVGGQAREALAIRPHFLAYFNPIGGGPAEGHRWFVDSSLDWGQDLPGLKAWLDTHADGRPVYLSYFGSGDPVHTGIQATRVGDGYFDWSPRTTPPALGGGTYAISATMLRRVYTHVRGPWDASYESAYQDLHAWLESLRGQRRDRPPTDSTGTPLTEAEVRARLFRYEQLQFGRLCRALERRLPDDHVGYSILIYRLSDAEVAQALYGPLEIP